ncbi:MAG: hypothetical protein HOP28_02805, partial [Gemmatimonadales bacterium]|nr:hypothetical protein [Gemmatimonadales bacterium]
MSKARPVHRWAAGRGIRVLPDADALLQATLLQPFDYLFSITNLEILPKAILDLPSQGAINFHDGPLPEYAGLNTPVWALLNGEPRHGVTWHLMTGAVDRGAVLTRRAFDISEGETALTLNTKCYEAGIESFEELVRDLGEGRLRPHPQDAAPGRIFRRSDRPSAAGVLDWTQSAETIATLIRALDFGTYPNPLVSPKTSHESRAIIVQEASLGERGSGAAPGTVLSIDDAGIQVATGDRNLVLRRLQTLDGTPLSPRDGASRLGIAPGGRFDLPNEASVARLTAVTAATCPHEPFWIDRLETEHPFEVPAAPLRGGVPNPLEYTHADQAPMGVGDGEEGVTAVLGYFARLGDCAEFDVGFADPALARLVEGVSDWFAGQVPLRAAVDFARGFDTLRESVRSELGRLRQHLTYSADLPARRPVLRSAGRGPEARPLPVSVHLVERLEDAAAPAGSALTVAVRPRDGATRWVADRTALGAEVAEYQAQFAEFCRAATLTPERA